MAIQVKLWRFSLSPVDGEVVAPVYLYSLRSNRKYLREQLAREEPGPRDDEFFDLMCANGRIEQIVSLRQVPAVGNDMYPNGERDWIPYQTKELGDFDLTIGQFFKPSFK